MIHPTAIIEPGAELAADVEVGAYSIIGAEVRIAEGCVIGPHVVIKGSTRIGRGNRFSQFCSIGDEPQSLSYQGEDTRVEIGDNNTFREYCTLNRGTVEDAAVTRVGNNNWIMAYVHIAHDCQVGSHCIFANGTSLAGHVKVEDYVIFGGFTMVHQFCRVGAHSFSAINTVTFKDIPPYLLVSGHTARTHGVHLKGLKRRRFSKSAIAELRSAYKTLFRSGKPLSEALEDIDPQQCGDEVRHLLNFIKESERGVVF